MVYPSPIFSISFTMFSFIMLFQNSLIVFFQTWPIWFGNNSWDFKEAETTKEYILIIYKICRFVFPSYIFYTQCWSTSVQLLKTIVVRSSKIISVYLRVIYRQRLQCMNNLKRCTTATVYNSNVSLSVTTSKVTWAFRKLNSFVLVLVYVFSQPTPIVNFLLKSKDMSQT